MNLSQFIRCYLGNDSLDIRPDCYSNTGLLEIIFLIQDITSRTIFYTFNDRNRKWSPMVIGKFISGLKESSAALMMMVADSGS